MKTKFFADYTVKEIKKEILFWETNGGQDPKKVDVIYIGQDPDADIYELEDDPEDETYEDFFAALIIDGKKVFKEYTLMIGTGSIEYAREIEM